MRDWCYDMWTYVLWYGRRPWHWLFGHGDCQVFLDAERRRPPKIAPVTSHHCCFCGLPCRER